MDAAPRWTSQRVHGEQASGETGEEVGTNKRHARLILTPSVYRVNEPTPLRRERSSSREDSGKGTGERANLPLHQL